MEESKDKNKKRFATIWRIVLVVMLLVNLNENGYKRSDHYKEKVMQDIMVSIKENQLGNIKITAIVDESNYETYEYTDLQW